VLYTVQNTAPTADAGAGGTVDEGNAIILDGTGTDTTTDASAQRYEWDNGLNSVLS